MLEKLLKLISSGGAYNIGDLSRRLDTSPELVQQALEMLARRGYLARAQDNPDCSCGACPSAKVCSPGKTSALYICNQKPGEHTARNTGA